MASVDLAFAKVAAVAGLTDVVYWRLWDVSEWSEFRGDAHLEPSSAYVDPGTRMTYESLRGRLDEALSAPQVVFWGDFMHMATYQRQTADVLSRRIGLCSPEKAADIAARTYLLRDTNEKILSRVLSYGSTLSMNTWRDYASQYGRDLEHFMTNVRSVWLRDPYSAQVVRAMRGQERGSAQGLDAAFLLHDGVHHGGGGMGVFIGRSHVQPEVVAAFGRRLSSRLRLGARWVPWGEPPAFWPVDSRRRFRAAWPGLEQENNPRSRIALLHTAVDALRGVPKRRQGTVDVQETIFGLADLDLVLTDTYHLAINAWAQGIPTVCLVDRGGSEWNVNSGEPHMGRDKRVDLYSQLDALGLIVELSGLRGRVAREVERVAELLTSKDLGVTVTDRIARERRQSLDGIVAHLRPQ